MAQIFDLTAATERAKEIVAFAEKTENWYRIGVTSWIPGDRPEFTLSNAGNIRAVFSWTWVRETHVIRHLSVSTKHGLPAPMIVWTLAHLFGFKEAKPDGQGLVYNPSPSWGFVHDKKEACIVVQEPV